MAQQTLAIAYCPVDSIVIDPQNPRVHSKRQVRQLGRSIEAFGFNVPILIDRRRRLIAGHGRLLAAQLLGMAQVPTITLENLSEAQIRMFMITDNRLTENSTWDERLLAEQFKSLSELELDFGVDVTGFEIGEIDLMIDGLAPTSRGKADTAAAVRASRVKPQVTRTDDLWEMGNHRLFCGDACVEATYAALMQGRRASVVFSDPPYNDRIDGCVAGFGKIHPSEAEMAVGKMRGAEYATFLTVVLTMLALHSADGALQFICMDWRHTSELLAAAQQAYTEFKNLCVWVKNVGDQGSLYRSQHELVFVFKSGKGAHRENIQLRQFDRQRTDVWKYRPAKSTARSTDECHSSGLHSNTKPIELVADAILDCTARGDIVLDPFLGSGATVIAAERTGRICYGIELDPQNVDASVRRWQKYTGLEAVHQPTGQTFAQREKEAPDARPG